MKFIWDPWKCFNIYIKYSNTIISWFTSTEMCKWNMPGVDIYHHWSCWDIESVVSCHCSIFKSNMNDDHSLNFNKNMSTKSRQSTWLMQVQHGILGISFSIFIDGFVLKCNRKCFSVGLQPHFEWMPFFHKVNSIIWMKSRSFIRFRSISSLSFCLCFIFGLLLFLKIWIMHLLA